MFAFLGQFRHVPLPPLFWAAIGCSTGIILSFASFTLSFWTFALFIPCLGIIHQVQQRTHRRIFCTLLLFIIAGYLRSSLFYASLEKSTRSLEGKTLSGFGTIIAHETGSSWYCRSCITLKITGLNADRVPPYSLLKIYLASPLKVQPGDHIAFKSLIFKRQKNEGSRWYIYKEGILGALFCKELSHKRVYRPRISIYRIRDRIRNRIRHNLSKALSVKTNALFSALFLGTKTAGYHSLRSVFMSWGIVHYLARSGLHVVVLVALWRWVFLLFRIPYLLTQCFLVAMIGIYYFLTWPSISFDRAVISFMFYQGYTFAKISFQMLQVISLVTIAMLLVNPLSLFCLDFQLSYGLTFALALFNEKIHQIRLLAQNDKLPL